MITKFLCQLDARNRKLLSGVVENDEDSYFEPGKTFPLVNEEGFRQLENDTVTTVFGKMGYMVFETEAGRRYVDINIFNDSVKITLTDNIAHAACFNEELFEVVLNYTEYFGLDECKFIFSGMIKGKMKNVDKYDNYFKKVVDASYVKINKGNKAYFLARNEEMQYFLSTDFSKASKVNKPEVRRVMIINGFVNEDTDRHDLSFSSFKSIASEESYIYGGVNPCRVSYTLNQIKIEREFEISTTDRLINNEEIFLHLKDVSYLIGKPEASKQYYCEIDDKYVKRNGLFDYEIVTNPYFASLINDNEIEVIKAVVKCYSETSVVKRKNKAFFLYYEGNKYSISNEPKEEFLIGKMIEERDRNAYFEAFSPLFNNKNLEDGSILIRDGKYLSITVNEDYSFNVLLTDSAYNASIFNKQCREAICQLLKWNFQEREISNLLDKKNIPYLNVTNNEDLSLGYKAIMDEIVSKKTTIIPYKSVYEIKTETEKGALEYLRRFYIKNILDTKELVKTALNYKPSIKNILVVAPKLNLELIGISLATDKALNVTTLNENKWGYMPKINIKSNVNYEATYRLKFQNLPKSFLEKFDLVIFGHAFTEEVSQLTSTFETLVNDDLKIIFANSIICNFAKENNDYFFEAIKNFIPIKRKYFKYDILYKDFVESENERFKEYLYRISQPINQEPKLEPEYSYYSILDKNGIELIDVAKQK